MSQPGQPCPVCQEFKKGPFDELLRIEKLREVPLRAIQLRKDEGCKSCALLCDGIDLLSDRWSPRRFLDEDQSELLVSWRTPVKGQPFRIRLSEDCYHKNPKERYILDLCEIEFIVRADSKCHWKVIRQLSANRKVVKSSDSSSAFDLIRNWVDNCIQSHPLCKLIESTSLPKRVIDVGGVIGGTRVHLYESKSEYKPYNALSHCWGLFPSQPLRTLKDDIEAKRENIPWAELSKTFQDAILVTQRLGIRYLWIDSLCIIQDDKDDWREQSGQMCRIYEGSYLTIAATRAHNGQDGCFSDRKSHQELYKGFSVRMLHDHSFWTTFPDPRADRIEHNPLFFRAWCLQERLLSTRVLHYAADELVWECKTCTLCECGDVTNWLGSRPFKAVFHATFTWQEIVQKYTAAKLTRYTDVLEALSGVASSMRKWSKGKYLAGMWTEDLVYDLLWMSAHTLNHRPPSYTAPSFSWASLIGPVRFNTQLDMPGNRSHVSLVDGHCTTNKLNPFGAVSNGFIKLRGSLLPAVLRNSEADSIFSDSGENISILPRSELSLELCFFKFVEESSPVSDNKQNQLRTGISEIASTSKRFIAVDVEKDWTSGTDYLVYCLPIVTGPKTEPPYFWCGNGDRQVIIFGRAYCLILTRNTTGTYRRVGIVDLFNVIGWEDVCPPMHITIV